MVLQFAAKVDELEIPDILNRVTGLPALVDRAAKTLAEARTSAEILEAREIAGAAYDMAKRAARLAKAKGAFDDLVPRIHRAQADALQIEAGAKRRLADEYDAAQERGEVAKHGQKRADIPDGNISTDIGVDAKDIHEGRILNDAEEDDPGVVKRALDDAVAAGEAPTRAGVKRAIKGKGKRTRTRKPRFNPNAGEESQHDRDLQMLLGVWEAACASAREAFLKKVT